MNETDAAEDHTSLVPGTHRLIRAVDGKEGPFAGTLVAFDDGVAVCVDVQELREWPGWAFSGSEHVCGVLDIRRRTSGHDALLPWCTQRVEAFLGRRDASDSPLVPGELGTLVASLLRGVRELGAHADVLGDWWLTGEGRPLFVHGEGGSARARTAALIERMGRQQTDRATARVLEEAASALHQPRHRADDDRRWEEHLFARAAPRALQLEVFAPERVSDIAPRLIAADVAAYDAESTRRRRPAGDRRSTDKKRERTAAAPADALRALAVNAREHLDRLRERQAMSRRAQPGVVKSQKPKRSRRRSVLVAGALGAAVLIVGLLWPSDGGDAPAEASAEKVQVLADSEGGSDDGETPAASSTITPLPTPSETSSSDAGTALDAVPGLLDAISTCIQDAVENCTMAVAEGARTPADGVASLGSSASTATMVDDYGDVAVIRLTPTTAEIAEQMIVLEHRNDIWRVRDVYDVAHPPD